MLRLDSHGSVKGLDSRPSDNITGRVMSGLDRVVGSYVVQMSGGLCVHTRWKGEEDLAGLREASGKRLAQN